ncbi:protein FAM216A [Hyperolius riggenbachi]|uniref:protein FAM216A n=1 Tax=Hyperolius riggenbachi TaxID=752182 RepID=UPI0035A3B3E0
MEAQKTNEYSSVCAMQLPDGRNKEFNHETEAHVSHSVCGQKNAERQCRTLESAPTTSQVRTIQIPTSMKNATFLQHPDLTMGQKLYLCSIARIYSTSNMRALIDHQLKSRIRYGARKAHLNHKTSGRIQSGTKDHRTTSDTRIKSCFSGMEDKSRLKDKQQTTTKTVVSIESTTQKVKSISMKDALSDH